MLAGYQLNQVRSFSLDALFAKALFAVKNLLISRVCISRQLNLYLQSCRPELARSLSTRLRPRVRFKNLNNIGRHETDNEPSPSMSPLDEEIEERGTSLIVLKEDTHSAYSEDGSPEPRAQDTAEMPAQRAQSLRGRLRSYRPSLKDEAGWAEHDARNVESGATQQRERALHQPQASQIPEIEIELAEEKVEGPLSTQSQRDRSETKVSFYCK